VVRVRARVLFDETGPNRWTPTEYVRCMNCSSFDAELNADSESARSIHRTYLGREKFPKKRPNIDQLDLPRG
jgi:hypothetical protein